MMRHFIRRAICATFVLCVVFVQPSPLWGQLTSQIVRFDNYSIPEGLSNSRVRAFFQDARGFIWVGTQAGLNRFDAYNFKMYRPETGDSFSLMHNGVLALLEDTKQNFWIGTQRGLQLFDWRTDRFYTIQLSSGEELGQVLALLEDSSGKVWVASTNGLFCVYASNNILNGQDLAEPFVRSLDIRTFQATAQAEGMPVNRVWSLKEDSLERLWVGTNAGLRCYSLSEERFLPIGFSANLVKLQKAVVHALELDGDGRLWVGTEDGLYKVDTKDFSGRVYHGTSTRKGALQTAFITELKLDKSARLWIGTNGAGLATWEAETDQFRHFTAQRMDSWSLPSNNIEALYVDHTGAIWAGTHDGLSYYNPAAKPFRVIYPLGSEYGRGLGTTQSLFASPDSVLWAGNDGAGLFALKGDDWKHFDQGTASGLQSNDFTGVIEDAQGRVWAASWTTGLYRLDRRTGVFLPQLKEVLEGVNVWNLYEDRQGRIWVGTAEIGPVLYYPETGEHRLFLNNTYNAERIGAWVIAMAEDEHGQVWATTSNGLYRYLEKEEAFEWVPVEGLDRSEYIHALRSAGKGLWWLGTQFGLFLLDASNGKSRRWTEADGLCNNWVRSMEKDSNGRLWLGTARGLSEFDSTKGTFTNYFTMKDSRSLEFSPASAQSASGDMYFGTTRGVVAFSPGNTQAYQQIPSVALTDFKLFNQSVPIKGYLNDNAHTPSPLSYSVQSAEPIRLTHWQHSFSFAFTSLSYLTPEYNQFRYRLKGYQNEWINTSSEERFAYYTNMPPGNYRFEVMASNCDGVWNEVPAAVDIVIRPPWWLSPWAYAAYVLLSIGLGVLLYRALKWRWTMRIELQQRQQEAIRLQELDDFKNRLYTNLTHEFRTPLTVILGLIDSIGKPEDIKPVMKRNAQGLLRLINQLLDLARLEAGQLKLDMVLMDVVPFVLYLTESFSSYAAGKEINLVTYTEADSILMDMDEQKLHSIVSNLLTNAIKFTPEGGKIVLHLRAEQETLVLKVKDTGVGIPVEQLPKVFNRFFRVDSEATRSREGTGVGLALTRELVELMGGDIGVKSEVGKGTEITVTLPITQTAAHAELEKGGLAVRTGDLSGIVASLGKEVQYFRSGGQGLPQLLLIEDNEDVAFYLRTCLADSFDLTLAPNGALGIAEALESIPDLIISDVMMPEKDGFEVCEALKADERTSHIPIILLTAKADTDAKIGGLRRGADAYLTKPFDRDELLVRLQALLERQRLLRAHFSQTGVTDESTYTAVKEVIEVEDAFFQKVRTIVEAHYQDESFALPQLCQKIRMSRSQLYRKMKAVADVSPSDYIRNHRLQQAKILLETTDLNVSEVAWKVGYKELSHFSRSYQEAFGVLPSATNKML